jgi:hypothetical protein
MAKPVVLAVVLILLYLLRPLLSRVLKLLFARTVTRAAIKGLGARAIAQQPDTIHLVAAQQHAWRNAAALEALAQPLKARGFVEAGVYTISEMPNIALRFLLNPAMNCYASICEHSKAGNWVELITRYESGIGFTYTQQPDRGMERRPEDKIFNAPGSAPEQLYERMIKERPDQPQIALSQDKLPQLFQDVYAAQIRWKKQRGAKPEEVVKIIKSLDKYPVKKNDNSPRP